MCMGRRVLLVFFCILLLKLPGTGIPCQINLTRSHCEPRRATTGGISITVNGIIGWYVLFGEGWRRKAQRVATGLHREVIVTVDIRYGRTRKIAPIAVQEHPPIRYARLTRILQAIVVLIAPDEVTNDCRLLRREAMQSGIPCQINLTRSHRKKYCLTIGRVGITINGIIAPLVLWTEDITFRRHEDLRVGAGLHGEGIETNIISRGGVDEIAQLIIQHHQHTRYARFIRSLDAISVLIVPDKVANQC